MKLVDEKEYRKRVYDSVKAIPHGRVMTYGQIAAILGECYTPRTVGYVMHAADSEGVPWQRVINSRGKCSTGRLTIPMNLQQEMLEQEGVIFDATGRCDLSVYQHAKEKESDADYDQISLFTESQ
jgi:methylated-DNA-protein-cysteine methyltransferase related protein